MVLVGRHLFPAASQPLPACLFEGEDDPRERAPLSKVPLPKVFNTLYESLFVYRQKGQPSVERLNPLEVLAPKARQA